MTPEDEYVFKYDGGQEQRRDIPKMINPRVYVFNLCLVLSGRSSIEARMAIVNTFPRDQPATVTPPFLGNESDWISPSRKRAIRIP